MARQPSPVQRVLPLLDPLLGCPSTIVETHHSFGASRHVRDDEAHPREQLSPGATPPWPPPAVPGPNSRHDTKSRRIGSLDVSAASPQVVSARDRSRIAALCCSAAVLRRRLAAPRGTHRCSAWRMRRRRESIAAAPFPHSATGSDPAPASTCVHYVRSPHAA